MKRKIGIALLLMMISMNLSASVPGKLAKTGAANGISNLVQSCGGGNAEDCFHMGNNYRWARDVEASDKKAEAYFKKACEGNYYQACDSLAGYHDRRGEIVEAAKLYKLACDKGIDSCFSVGLNYQSGTGVEKDYALAIKYFKMNAEEGDLDCAAEDKSNVTCKNIAKSEKAAKNKDSAHPYLDKAMTLYKDECENKGMYSSCNSLSFVYKRGWGGYKNADLSKKYKEMSEKVGIKECENGNKSTCLNLVYTYSDKKDFANTLKFAKKAEALGDGQSLTIVAKMYQEGNGVTQNKGKAKTYYLKAARVFRKQCRNGDGYGCISLSRLFSYGQGVPQDKKRETKYKTEACDKGEAFACLVLGRYEDKRLAHESNCDKGDISECKEVDILRARELYRDKCAANDAEACFKYAGLEDELN